MTDEPVSLTCSKEEMEQLKALARSTTAGVWRIKRAKALLGALEGISPSRLMYRVRVPVQTILKFIRDFSEHGMKCFERPDRGPTARETDVERMLAFLDHPPEPSAELWDILRLQYIGMDFRARDIRRIRELIAGTPDATRSGVARQLCKEFNLHDLAGKPRTATVHDILWRMQMDNIVFFPTRHPFISRKLKIPPKSLVPEQEVVIMAPHELMSLVFVPVRSREESLLWNAMIHHYHYIPGHRLFGPQLRYLVYRQNDPSDGAPPLAGRLLAALSFSSCAWRVSSRDAYIGWNDEQRIANLPLVINNSRFLILPWIRARNLASRILGAMAKRAPRDWEAQYGRRPVLLETFVERERFRGTCYKAANWIEAGDTVGYSLHGQEKRKGQPARSVFLYPLHRRFREILCRL